MARGKDPSIEAYRLLQSARHKSAGSSYPVSTDRPVPRRGASDLEDPGAHGPFATAAETRPAPAVRPKPAQPESAIGTALSNSREVVDQEVKPVRAPWSPSSVVLALIALAVAFGLGRLSVGGSVAAAPGSVGDGRGERVALQGNDPTGQLSDGALDGAEANEAQAKQGRTPADLAFLDPANRLTIRAITYDKSRQALAVENYEHLVALGLPVVYPRFKGDRLVIFIGASSSKDSRLDALWDQVRATAGPNGRGTPYDSAIIVNILGYR